MYKYKIGQLAKTMGVSTHLLKHYEKYQIVNPVIDDNTNYRYYELNQCSKIIESKKYRNIGFSIKDTATLMNNSDNKNYNIVLKNHCDTLDMEIKKLLLNKELTMKIYNSSVIADKYLNQWFIEMHPSLYVLKQSNNKEIIYGNTASMNSHNLTDMIPLCNSLILFPLDFIDSYPPKYNWCLSIEENIAQEYNLQLNNLIKIPESKAFTVYLRVAAPYTENRVLIDSALKIFRGYSFTPTKDIFAISIKTTHEEGQEFHYFKVYIPIE